MPNAPIIHAETRNGLALQMEPDLQARELVDNADRAQGFGTDYALDNPANDVDDGAWMPGPLFRFFMRKQPVPDPCPECDGEGFFGCGDDETICERCGGGCIARPEDYDR